nr:16S rRNA (cytosine(967)-C(5))-methyltransferase RsmB [Diplocloster modestus]
MVLGILMEVTGKGTHSHLVIRDVLSKYQYLGKQERSFITRVSIGTLEQMILIDYIIDQFSSVKVKKMKPVIRNILRSAVYQLKWMDSIPDSAVCNEAVKLTRKKGFQGLSGFVNGVLRSITRGLAEIRYPDEKENPAEYMGIRYSQPLWLTQMWLARFGPETTGQILRAFLDESPTCIRCSTGKIRAEELADKLNLQGIETIPSPYIKEAMEIRGYDHLGALPEFKQGLFQVQDVSSMLAVRIAAPAKGDIVYDVCAAPGGKSLYLAELMENTGMVTARDLTPYKVGLIEENIQRSGLTNIRAQVWDACVLDESAVETADLVLADLPCSGLGVLGRKPDIKYHMSPGQMQELCRLQREILGTVHNYVKKGGVLVYSTCTIDREENEENLDWFLNKFPFHLEKIDPYLCEELRNGTTARGYLQLLPGVHRADGFFMARLRKDGE